MLTRFPLHEHFCYIRLSKTDYMTRIVKTLVSALLIMFLGLHLHAQEKSHVERDDSSRMQMLGSQSQIIGEIQAIRIADSVKMATLEREIRELKSYDQAKKKALQREIDNTRLQDSIRSLDQRKRIDSLRLIEPGYPVVPFPRDTLYTLYSNIGAFTPKERAAGQVKRIQELADDYQFNTDSLIVRPSETTSDIYYKDMIIFGVTDVDALWEGTDRQSLALKYKAKIALAVAKYREETSLSTISKNAGIALGILLLFGTFLHFMNRLFRFIRRKIELYGATRMKGFNIKGYALLDTNREIRIAVFISTILKWFLILIVVYFTLLILFGLFPWTRHISETLLGFFINPLVAMFRAVVNYLPNLFTIVVIVFVFRLVMKGILFLKSEIENESLKIPGFHPELANPTFQITRVLFYSFMFVVIFPYLPGSESPVFKGVSVFLGVIFTFGSSGSLSNVVAGLVLTYMRSFRIGDRIRIGQDTGDVIEKGLLVTRIRTPKNEIISIPNSNALNTNLVNYSSDASDRGLIIHSSISIGYDAEWRLVYQLLLDAAAETEFIEKEPAPFVLQTALDDFYVSYQINAYLKNANIQASVYSQLYEKIQDKFNEAGVQIMSPHYEADKETVVIPERYLKKQKS
jgi:small-conductance mechanosensitive channel